jgi:acetylornithine deacetylase/succinyl-diaminopimelate desuccinylase-like protein
MDASVVTAAVGEAWRDRITPALLEYVAIPALSPHFDADWAAHGHLDAAVSLVEAWCRQRPIAGMQIERVQLPGRTPVLLMEIPATDGADPDVGTVLLYGHADKQPEMTGWREGLGPWTPVIEGDRLYGRGAADDGYSAFAALTAIEAIVAAGGEHGRCVVLIEASEESGSPDLPAYVEALADRIGDVRLVIALDSGAGSYERFWYTTSLRGMVAGTLRVDVLRDGVHSGSASGVVPDSFRLVRLLLDRIEDPVTGRVLLPELHAPVPPDRRREAEDAAAEVDPSFPFHGTTQPSRGTPAERVLARTWEPTLTVVGAAGLPETMQAGNVLRPFTEVRLSVRLPPTVDPDAALQALERALLASPPQDATVTWSAAGGGPGWNAPSFEPWLQRSVQAASTAVFGLPAGGIGEGGSIPFMGMLGERFPRAQFLVTGVLGPDNGAHGPNEFLHLRFAEGVTAVVAHVLHDHAVTSSSDRADA